jgi:long-chain acyl-CoA synthetase
MPDGARPPFTPAMTIQQAHALLCQPGTPFEMEERVIAGAPMRVWKNAPPSLAAIFEMGRAWGPLPYLVLEEERVSYAAHANAAATLAHVLRDRFGVQKGDRVGIAMRNIPELVCAFWAAQLLGAVAMPLNAWWTAQELEYGLADSGASVLIADGERLERLMSLEHQGVRFAALPDLKHVLVTRAASTLDGAVRLEDVIGGPQAWDKLAHTPAPQTAIDPEDPATLFYTSGTTGKPKGALGSQRNCITNLFNTMLGQTRAFLRRGEAPPAPDPAAPKKAFLLSIPLFHVTASHSIMVPAMATGMKIVMMRRWDATRGLELIEQERITNFGGVPAIAWQVLEHPDLSKYDTSSVESVSYGGAPSAPELVRRIVEAFPKVQPGQGYGLTETSAAVTSVTGEDYELRPWSCGPIAPVNDVRIVDSEGRDVPQGEVGELWVRGPNVVMGYWNKPEATEAAFGDGWFKTGDLVRIDEETFLTIVDRAKDMIIRGGENVYCVEVESALYEHPDVNDAAVVGIPHKVLGEEVGAIVAVREGSDASEASLQAWVRERLAGFKVPVRIDIRTEPLPRNPNGKILKRGSPGRSRC